MKFFPALLLLSSVALVLGSNPLAYYKVVYGWNQIDYKFPSNQTRNRLLSSKEFIPENNVITGLKIKGQRMFVTVPRWRQGVPSSLNFVDFNPATVGQMKGPEINQETPNGPLLIPYPSWEMNQLGNCNALQYIQSMEIDQFNRMWVVDVGRVNIFTEPDNKCPPKLVIIDLDTDEVVLKYDFPANVVSPTSNFLNDIAVGCVLKDECFAYISDATDSKIVVYDMKDNRSWFVHHSSMKIDPEAVVIPILGSNYTFNTNIDGIALSPKDSNFDRLFFCPLSSYNLYSVPTIVLKTAVNGITLSDSDVTNVGRKSSQSDGLAVDAKGLLYYGLLQSNGVAYFNTSESTLTGSNEVLLVQNDVDLQWADTFAFDEAGNLYTTSNRLHRFQGDKYDFSEINFRVVSIFTGSDSYMFSAKNKMKEKVTVAPAVLDATPVTNLDPVDPFDGKSQPEEKEHEHLDHDIAHPNNKYETPDTQPNHNENVDNNLNVNDVKEVPKSESNKSEEPLKSSSSQMDMYTGTLVFVLATFVFHPVV